MEELKIMTLRELKKVANRAVYESTLRIYDEQVIEYDSLSCEDENRYLDYIVDDVCLTVEPDMHERTCVIAPKMIICIYKGE